MTHIKGIRFDLPLVRRLGLIDDSEAHRIAWNTHEQQVTARKPPQEDAGRRMGEARWARLHPRLRPRRTRLTTSAQH